MSIKTKLTSLITTFVLLCSLLTVGVFAVKNTTFNVGGDIVFNVQGIEATITRGATAGFTADKTIGDAEGNILSNIILNNDMSAQEVADEFAPWSGLNLAFSDNVATIKLTIKNTAEEGADNYLDISAIASATTKNNARVSVVNDAGGVTALLQPQQSATFTITFSVIDDEYSASLNDFSVNFDMQKKVLADFPELVENEDYETDMAYQTLKFATIEGRTGLIVSDVAAGYGNYESTGDLVIPSYVNKGGSIYPVTMIGALAFGDGSESAYDMTGVTIPNTITSIGEGAFSDCSGLTSITIPDSVTYIDQVAFYGCTSLTSITISNTITSIGEGVFSGCSSLSTVNYRGTQEEWNALLENIGEGNDPLLSATVNFI